MKTVTLKDEAYYKLASLKSGNESFSEVIEKLYEESNPPLEKYFGILEKKGYESAIKTWESIKKKDKELFVKKMQELENR